MVTIKALTVKELIQLMVNLECIRCLIKIIIHLFNGRIEQERENKKTMN